MKSLKGLVIDRNWSDNWAYVVETVTCYPSVNKALFWSTVRSYERINFAIYDTLWIKIVSLRYTLRDDIWSKVASEMRTKHGYLITTTVLDRLSMEEHHGVMQSDFMKGLLV